jgi:sec-independent protein translocase protein TatA
VDHDDHEEEPTMPTLGPWELGIILLIVVVIFGAGRLPEIGGAIGKSIRSFKSEVTDETKKAAEETARTATTADLAAEARPVAKDEVAR